MPAMYWITGILLQREYDRKNNQHGHSEPVVHTISNIIIVSPGGLWQPMEYTH